MTAPVTGLRAGQYVFEGARMLLLDVSISGDAAAPLLPAPLVLSEPATATFFFADYPKTNFGSVYQEAGLLLHVQDDAGPAIYCPWIVVDDDTALILGREMFGFPKKMAEVDFRVEGNAATGVVRRKGHEVLRVEAVLGDIDPEPGPVFARRALNVLGSFYTGLKLLEASTEERVESARRAEGKVVVLPSRRDRLHELEPASSGEGRFVVLDYGTVATMPRVVGDVDAAWVGANFFRRAL